jgi:hypothetical protein
MLKDPRRQIRIQIFRPGGNLAVYDKTVCREEGPHAACLVGFIARTE